MKNTIYGILAKGVIISLLITLSSLAIVACSTGQPKQQLIDTCSPDLDAKLRDSFNLQDDRVSVAVRDPSGEVAYIEQRLVNRNLSDGRTVKKLTLNCTPDGNVFLVRHGLGPSGNWTSYHEVEEVDDRFALMLNNTGGMTGSTGLCVPADTNGCSGACAAAIEPDGQSFRCICFFGGSGACTLGKGMPAVVSSEFFLP